MLLRRKAVFICFVISFLIFGSINFSWASPSKPYNLILDNIQKEDFNRAYYWIEIVLEDFPESEEAELANYLKIPLLFSERMAHVSAERSVMVGIVNLANDSYRLKEYGPEYRDALIKFEDIKFNKSKTLELIGNFIDEYSSEKTYNFNLDKVLIDMNNRGWSSLNLNLKKITEGRVSSIDVEDLIEEMKVYFLFNYLIDFSNLEVEGQEKRAELFYKIASDINNVFDIEKGSSGYEIALEALDLSIEHSSRYSDTRINAEELKDKILEE